MPHLILAIMVYALPLIILSLPFIILCYLMLKKKPTIKEAPLPLKPDTTEMEQKLAKLIEINSIAEKNIKLHQDLAQTPTHIIAEYININKKNLKSAELFALIFTMIRQHFDDDKIIRLLAKVFPTCALAHLHAMLKSFKEFLHISEKDNTQKELINNLSQNQIRPILIYLEKKINQTLNEVKNQPQALQQQEINRAVIYGLIFAAFSEFYNTVATEKILKLTYMLSPELFKYWHTIPENIETSPPYRNKKRPIMLPYIHQR